MNDVVVQGSGKLSSLVQRSVRGLGHQPAAFGPELLQVAGQDQGRRQDEQGSDDEQDEDRQLPDESHLGVAELRALNLGFEQITLAVRAAETGQDGDVHMVKALVGG